MYIYVYIVCRLRIHKLIISSLSLGSNNIQQYYTFTYNHHHSLTSDSKCSTYIEWTF